MIPSRTTSCRCLHCGRSGLAVLTVLASQTSGTELHNKSVPSKSVYNQMKAAAGQVNQTILNVWRRGGKEKRYGANATPLCTEDGKHNCAASSEEKTCQTSTNLRLEQTHHVT